jgi:DNA-binding beta-propeller fold protein YncE
VRASDGTKTGEFSGGDNTSGVLAAMGKVFVTGQTNPGTLYVIDPTQASGTMTTLTTNLGATPEGIAFDGQRIWTANFNLGGSVSIVSLNPVTVTNVSVPGAPVGLAYDGANMWVTDASGATGTLKKLDSNGNILMVVPVGASPFFPVFDGTNVWVPNHFSNSVSVVRATGPLAGTVLATLTGNGLSDPDQAAFDGERILVVNRTGDSVSVWKASDMTPIGTFSTGAGTAPLGVCSDELNFWMVFSTANKLARF